MSWFSNVLGGRSSLVRRPDSAGEGDTAPRGGPVQVIVYAHGPVERIRACLQSLLESFPARDLFIVQDSRDAAVGQCLIRFTADNPCTLIQNLDVLGFQRSIAKAMHVCTAEYLAVVDSDVVVIGGGLHELAAELAADPAVELAFGLLDVQLDRPRAPTVNGNAELVAAAIESRGTIAAPDWRLASFTGHPCFTFRRSALAYFVSWETARTVESEANAPHFRVRVVPSCYVSYRSTTVIQSTYQPVLDALSSGLDSRLLDGIANAVLEAKRVRRVLRERVLFLLPSPGGTGGAHSVVQEVAGLRQCGLDATIANHASHRRSFERHYPEAGDFCFYHADEEELVQMTGSAAIVVATNYVSVASLKSIVERNPAVVPFYYVQDYEPWFYSEQDARHAAAKSSYRLVPNQTAFAKTEWLCNTVRDLAGIDVVKVSPGLDRKLYNGLAAGSSLRRLSKSARVTIAAMIRPGSARRNPKGTLNVLRQIQRNHARVVDIRVFGCRDEDLDLLEEAAGFRFVNLGELERWEVADVLRGADIFVDLSTYQAFGRTGLEAMATGCATVLPRGSGVEEYAVHGQNCLLVDSADDGAAVGAIEQLIADRGFMQRIRREALKSGRQYSVRRAVWSQLCLFGDSLALNRGSATGRSIVVAR